jgi:hypothetical protein
MGVTQGQETACLLPQTHRARKRYRHGLLQEVVVDRNPADELTDLLILFCIVSFFGRLTRPDKRHHDGRP